MLRCVIVLLQASALRGLILQERRGRTELQTLGFLTQSSSEHVLAGDIGSVKVFTIETRTFDRSINVSGVPGLHATNPSPHAMWRGWRTKNCYAAKHLTALVATDPNQLVVMIDNPGPAGDMMYGGCSEKQLRDSYERTVKASGGAPVVAGAELGAFPEKLETLLHFYKDFDTRREAVLQAHGLKEDAYAQHANCTFFPGPCSNPPRYQFINGGFRMGPAEQVLNITQELCKGHQDEQNLIAHMMFKRPDALTLDYSGSLVVDLHNFAEGAFEFLKPEDPTSAADGQRIVRNTVTGQTACFVHGNGVEDKTTVRQLVAHLA